MDSILVDFFLPERGKKNWELRVSCRGLCFGEGGLYCTLLLFLNFATYALFRRGFGPIGSEILADRIYSLLAR